MRASPPSQARPSRDSRSSSPVREAPRLPTDSLILETEGVLSAWRKIQARARDLEREGVPA